MQRAPAYMVTPVVGGLATLESAAVPPGQLWSVSKIIVATDGLAAGLAIIYTGSPSDWTGAIWQMAIANGVATWEPRKFVMSDGEKIYAAVSGASLAAFARLEMLYQPMDVMPERTRIDATHIRVGSHPHDRGDVPEIPDALMHQTGQG